VSGRRVGARRVSAVARRSSRRRRRGACAREVVLGAQRAVRVVTCSRSSSAIVSATVSAMAPLGSEGGHLYFGETGHLHFGLTRRESGASPILRDSVNSPL